MYISLSHCYINTGKKQEPKTFYVYAAERVEAYTIRVEGDSSNVRINRRWQF